MAEVITGRQTATVDDDVVVFLIGMRINRLRASADRGSPPSERCRGCCASSPSDPSLGLLGVRSVLVRSSDPRRPVLALVRAPRAVRSLARPRAPAGLARVQPAGPRQRRRRDLPRDVPGRAGDGGDAVREHAAVRAGWGDRHRAGGRARPVGRSPHGHGHASTNRRSPPTDRRPTRPPRRHPARPPGRPGRHAG